MASFGEVLQYFKQNESPEMITPLVEDGKLRNALVAWQSVRIKYNEMQECAVEADLEKWEWLWSRVKYDPGCFGVVAGLQPREVGQMLARLTGLRLIYPDGTISGYAKAYLKSLIMSKLPSSQRKSKNE